MPDNITPIFLPSRAPELNPVENVWQYLRQNWLSNTVFENYDAIIDAACAAWQKLVAEPETITSIAMRATGLTSVSRYDPWYQAGGEVAPHGGAHPHYRSIRSASPVRSSGLLPVPLRENRGASNAI